MHNNTKMDKCVDILYFAPIDWHFIRQRPQQLATALSKRYRVFYTSPRTILGLRKLKKLGAINSLWDLSEVECINKRLIVYHPQILPENNFVHLKKLNERLFRFHIQRFIQKNSIKVSVLWIGHPWFAHFVDRFEDSLICYDCMDNWSEFPYPAKIRALIQSKEAYLISKADVVFASSRFLFKKAQQNRKEVYLIPNGVDIEHFSKAIRNPLPVPREIENLKKPLIGYIGAVAEWLDFELITYLAEKKRDCNFIFIGPRLSPMRFNWRKLTNVYFLGLKSYESLPAYLQHMDIFILPFKIDRLSQSVDPVKVYEYLASGREIVATDMPEIYKFKELIKIARTKEEFLELLNATIEKVKSKHLEQEAKLDAVKNSSWENNAKEIEQIMGKRLKI